MLVFPNAKINLGLNIISKRNDGYHNLETVFYPIGLEDILEVLPQTNTKMKNTIETHGMTIDCAPESNLILKAHALLNKHYSIPSVKIYLEKHIPLGAGLGGGSSDASFMLQCLSNLFELNLTEKQLCNYALELGSDCPFFILNKPVYASERGEQFQPVTLNLSGYFLILVHPSIHISTREAFSHTTPQKPQHTILDILNQDINQWRNLLHNDFEKSIFAQYPEIGIIKDQMYQAGALYASMSGSGSAVYGIFKEETAFESPHYIWKGLLK